ncbi:prepilin peptidase [Sinanaerobacter chloroacetimidivorans]|uniref:Prepilin peptidase n=1 Tax=Sinanaerobacter chloroacetimidivorans TaxID=2818044 RepID=A0A8J7W504_9FIRM|nr:A24 family peptidase [Sinanaerobacter chloroacetimidivorans]MBR0600411.1 prepilin peptidase [Sinanaerobacter chloroacetimidivorans]
MDTTVMILEIILCVTAGIVAGLSAIYVFNRIPAKWLCDYNEEPEKGMWGERIKKRPWNAVFTLVFAAASVKMLDQGFLYVIAGLLALWLLLQIGMADKLYLIIPDQFIIALAVTALGFIPFQPDFLAPLYGALLGGGCLLLMGIVGKILFKKEAMGFGDVKLLAAIGLISGIRGTVFILLITIFLSGFVFGILLILKKIKPTDSQPLGPFIAAAAAFYLIFLRELTWFSDLYLNSLL